MNLTHGLGTERPVPAGVRVASIDAGSPAQRAGLAPGDRILSVSGKPVEDLLDLHVLTSRRGYRIRWIDSRGRTREKTVRPGQDPLGVHPEPIRPRRCGNRCLFCFVHQLPRGLRRSLYVKDEDVRLSFLHGQYVTLTDVAEPELRRIVRYGLSPLFVSIHAADLSLRRRMLGNPRAADVMVLMRRLIAGGIRIHGQIVVCPGINDGEVLACSLRELVALRPGLSSVAVVPVGLTAHRQGLPPLRPVSREEAVDTLGMIARLNAEAGDGGDGAFAAAADEYYLLAGREVPPRRAYGSFAQIENGVGLLRRFLDEARCVFRKTRWRGARDRGGTVVTGLAARRYVGCFLEEFSRRSGARFDFLPVPNRLLGETVTVTGLLAGADILAALSGRRMPRIYIPSVCLRDAGDLFLDGLSPEDVSRESGVPVIVFPPTPRGFYGAVFGGTASRQ